MANNWWKPLVIGGLISLTAVGLYRGLVARSKSSRLKIESLKEVIERAYASGASGLCPLTKEVERVQQRNGVEMTYVLTTRLNHKNRSKDEQVRDPFIYPYEDGLLVCELGSKHALLFNKFNVFSKHLLVVTKDFQPQESLLTKDDFCQVIAVTKALKGLFFYNYGEESGRSQEHKHFQILPEEARDLPMFQRILAFCRQQHQLRPTQMLFYPPFAFKHGITLIAEEQNTDSTARLLASSYNTLHKHLVETHQYTSFNLIGCDQFLLLIPRKKQSAFDQLAVNSVGFLGSVLFKNKEMFDRYLAQGISPTDILEDITYK